MTETQFSQADLVQLVYSSLPYSDQITELDLETDKDAMFFVWRRESIKVKLNREVYTIEKGSAVGSNLSILIRTIIKREYARLFFDGAYDVSAEAKVKSDG